MLLFANSQFVDACIWIAEQEAKHHIAHHCTQSKHQGTTEAIAYYLQNLEIQQTLSSFLLQKWSQKILSSAPL